MAGKTYICVDSESLCNDVDEYTPEEIEEMCCEQVPVDKCAKFGKRIEVFHSLPQDEFPEETQELLIKAKYDPCIEIRYNSRGGNPCGTKETIFERTGTCCDYPPEIYWGSFPVDQRVSYDGEYLISAGSQNQPYSFQALGTGLDMVKISNTEARLFVDDCFCDPGLIVCTDACGQSIVRLVYLSGGTWDSITATALGSDYGWPQDGDPVHIYILGLNDKRTKYSIQSYGVVEASSEEAVCALALSKTNYQSAAPVAIPGQLDGYQQCSGGGNVWWKDVTGDPRYKNNFRAYYATTEDRYSREWNFDSCTFDEFFIDEPSSSTTIAVNSQSYVFWEGGFAPFTVSVSGPDAWLDTEKTVTQIETSGRAATIYSGPDCCAVVSVSIFDSCGQSLEWALRAVSGYWCERDRVFHGPGTQCPIICESEDKRWKYEENWCAGCCDNCDGPGYANMCGPHACATTVEGGALWEWICPNEPCGEE